MAEQFDATLAELKAYWGTGPQYALPGWQMKTVMPDIEVPIAVIPEPIGGMKNDAGRSPRSEAFMKLLIVAPKMAQLLKGYMDKEWLPDADRRQLDDLMAWLDAPVMLGADAVTGGVST